MQNLKDDDLMPWGIHKNKTMANVPDEYLLQMYKSKKAKGNVLEYIKDNLEAICSNLGVKEPFD